MIGFVWYGGISHSSRDPSASPDGNSNWNSPPLLYTSNTFLIKYKIQTIEEYKINKFEIF